MADFSNDIRKMMDSTCNPHDVDNFIDAIYESDVGFRYKKHRHILAVALANPNELSAKLIGCMMMSIAHDYWIKQATNIIADRYSDSLRSEH